MIAALLAGTGPALGFPDPRVDVAGLRWVLTLVVVAAALLVRRWLWRGALAGSAVLFVVSVGFWVATLQRPRGLLVDPEVTAWSAQVAVAAATGNASESFVSGLPSRWPAWSALAARLGGSVDLVTLADGLPLLVPPLLAGALLWLGGRTRSHGALAAAVLLAFGTGDLDALRTSGLLPGLWQHRDAGLALAVALPLALAAARLGRARLGALAAALVVLGAAVAVRPGRAALGPGDALLLLTLDQGLWLFAAGWAFRRGATADARGLAAGGAAATLLATAGLADAWLGAAAFRTGLLLAAVEPVEALADALGRRLAEAWPCGTGPRHLGALALVLVFVPGSFLFRWDPRPLDAVVEASIHDPLSPNVVAAMDWIRAHTPPEAVFVTGERYAPWVAAVARRRVLRAPLLARPEDDSRRRRTEKQLLSGQPPADLVRLYGLRYVLAVPGDFRAYGINWPTDLEGRPGLRRVYADDNGFHVYEISTP